MTEIKVTWLHKILKKSNNNFRHEYFEGLFRRTPYFIEKRNGLIMSKKKTTNETKQNKTKQNKKLI